MDSAIQEEKQLIQRAKKDPEAFGMLYDRYYRPIFRFILSRTGNLDLAKDLTSETFFQALKNLWRFHFAGRPFSAWLYKIAKTQIAQFYRQKSKYCEISLEEFPQLFHQEDASQEIRENNNQITEILKNYQDVHSLLASLKPIQQDVLILRYFEDKSLQEISDIFHININTVKSHIRRALQTLRKFLENDNPPHQDHEKLGTRIKKLFKAKEAAGNDR